jgi:hypothetical protein
MRFLTALTVLGLTTMPTLACEYTHSNYETYGYGSAASTMGLGLNAGLRGAHVASNDHKENGYYPGYAATNPNSESHKDH